jgi:hypothetical protein
VILIREIFELLWKNFFAMPRLIVYICAQFGAWGYHKMVLIIKTKRKRLQRDTGLKTTHKLIDKLQMLIESRPDTVITKACKMLYKQLAK